LLRLNVVVHSLKPHQVNAATKDNMFDVVDGVLKFKVVSLSDRNLNPLEGVGSAELEVPPMRMSAMICCHLAPGLLFVVVLTFVDVGAKLFDVGSKTAAVDVC
jgi:hypothetical protein